MLLRFRLTRRISAGRRIMVMLYVNLSSTASTLAEPIFPSQYCLFVGRSNEQDVLISGCQQLSPTLSLRFADSFRDSRRRIDQNLETDGIEIDSTRYAREYQRCSPHHRCSRQYDICWASRRSHQGDLTALVDFPILTMILVDLGFGYVHLRAESQVAECTSPARLACTTTDVWRAGRYFDDFGNWAGFLLWISGRNHAAMGQGL